MPAINYQRFYDVYAYVCIHEYIHLFSYAIYVCMNSCRYIILYSRMYYVLCKIYTSIFIFTFDFFPKKGMLNLKVCVVHDGAAYTGKHVIYFPKQLLKSITLYRMYILTLPENIPQTPITKRTLNTADPTIVPVPTSPLATRTPVKIN